MVPCSAVKRPLDPGGVSADPASPALPRARRRAPTEPRRSAAKRRAEKQTMGGFHLVKNININIYTYIYIYCYYY